MICTLKYLQGNVVMHTNLKCCAQNRPGGQSSGGVVPESNEHARRDLGSRHASVQFPPLLCLPSLTVGHWETLPPGSEDSSKPSPHFGREGPAHTRAKTSPHHKHGRDCSLCAFQFERPRRDMFPILSGILIPAAPANTTPVPTFSFLPNRHTPQADAVLL